MKENKNEVFYIDPRKIDVMEGFNQRHDFGDIDELASQIKEQGLLEAISVVPYMKGDEERFLLINGERRYRALSKLIAEGEDVGTVKANFIDPKTSDADLIIQQFMRNEGKKFNDVEFGLICKKLKDLGMSNIEIAKKLGKNPGVVSYALQSLDYDPRIQEMIANGEIGGTEVRRMYTAARKKYGDDWQKKADEEILKLKKHSAEEGQAKVSIKTNDLYGDVKDTKTFVYGMKVLKQYIEYFQSRGGKLENLSMNVFEMFDAITQKDSTLTLRDIFEKALKDANKTIA